MNPIIKIKIITILNAGIKLPSETLHSAHKLSRKHCRVVWSEKLKILLSILPFYQTLPFDMGFKKSKSFSKNLMARFVPNRPFL